MILTVFGCYLVATFLGGAISNPLDIDLKPTKEATSMILPIKPRFSLEEARAKTT